METLVNEQLLRERLTPYKRVTPYLLDVFIWRYDSYPLLIVSMVTSFFLLVYYTEPSLITLVSMILLLVVTVDFFVGLLFSGGGQSPDKETFSDDDEKKFTILANRICYYSVLLWNASVGLEEWRLLHPNWYSISLITGLLATAWIGNSVNNLLLVYLLSLFLSLLPGLLHRNLIQLYSGRLVLFILDLFKKGGGGGEKKRE